MNTCTYNLFIYSSCVKLTILCTGSSYKSKSTTLAATIVLQGRSLAGEIARTPACVLRISHVVNSWAGQHFFLVKPTSSSRSLTLVNLHIVDRVLDIV